MLAGAFVGVSLTFTFLSLYNYMIDTYLQVAASALAANTVCRSLFGAGFPVRFEICFFVVSLVDDGTDAMVGLVFIALCDADVRHAESALGIDSPGVHSSHPHTHPIPLLPIRCGTKGQVEVFHVQVKSRQFPFPSHSIYVAPSFAHLTSFNHSIVIDTKFKFT